MAEESQDGQDKTEEPSQRKIDKSKEDGKSSFLKGNVCFDLDGGGVFADVCDPYGRPANARLMEPVISFYAAR